MQTHPEGCTNPTSPVGSRKKGWMTSMIIYTTIFIFFIYMNIFSTTVWWKTSILLQGLSGNWSRSAGTISVLHSCGETASKSLFQQPGSTYSFNTKSSMLEAREQISLGGSLKLFTVILLTVSAELLTLNSLQTEINSTSARPGCKPSAGFKRYAVGISTAQRVFKKTAGSWKMQIFQA